MKAQSGVLMMPGATMLTGIAASSTASARVRPSIAAHMLAPSAQPACGRILALMRLPDRDMLQSFAVGSRDAPRARAPHDLHLVRLLPKWSDERYPLYVYYPSRNLPSARVRAFVDFIVAAVAALQAGVGHDA